jgi:hypothetical protein
MGGARHGATSVVAPVRQQHCNEHAFDFKDTNIKSLVNSTIKLSISSRLGIFLAPPLDNNITIRGTLAQNDPGI